MVGFMVGLFVGVVASWFFNHWDVVGPEIKRLLGK